LPCSPYITSNEAVDQTHPGTSAPVSGKARVERSFFSRRLATGTAAETGRLVKTIQSSGGTGRDRAMDRRLIALEQLRVVTGNWVITFNINF